MLDGRQVDNVGVAVPIPGQSNGYSRCFGLVLDTRQAVSAALLLPWWLVRKRSMAEALIWRCTRGQLGMLNKLLLLRWLLARERSLIKPLVWRRSV